MIKRRGGAFDYGRDVLVHSNSYATGSVLGSWESFAPRSHFISISAARGGFDEHKLCWRSTLSLSGTTQGTRTFPWKKDFVTMSLIQGRTLNYILTNYSMSLSGCLVNHARCWNLLCSFNHFSKLCISGYRFVYSFGSAPNPTSTNHLNMTPSCSQAKNLITRPKIS